jgi:pimeloyl-ACP methyl ester carboxylesterase
MTSNSKLAESDLAIVARINATGAQPVLFLHGLWLHPSSWKRWSMLFEAEGYGCLAPRWPHDEETVEVARAGNGSESEALAGLVNSLENLVRQLRRKPVLIGHSFGGLIAQLITARGVASCTVAIAPAAFRGVLPLPLSALRSASPVLRNARNRHREVSLSVEEFRYAFGNAVSEDEARRLYEQFAVPAPGGPLFEAAFANLNPWTADQLDPKSSARGPLLLMAGEQDHTVPPVVVEAEYRLQQRNPAPTEYILVPGRGHALVIDDGWKDVAKLALAFCRRFSPPSDDLTARPGKPRPEISKPFSL